MKSLVVIILIQFNILNLAPTPTHIPKTFPIPVFLSIFFNNSLF